MVVCILKGCVYFFVDLTRGLTVPHSTYFLEASSYHDSQTQAETVELLRYVHLYTVVGRVAHYAVQCLGTEQVCGKEGRSSG